MVVQPSSVLARDVRVDAVVRRFAADPGDLSEVQRVEDAVAGAGLGGKRDLAGDQVGAHVIAAGVGGETSS